MEQVGLLVVPVRLRFLDDLREHRAEGNHGINALGAQQSDALVTRLGALRQRGHDENFQRCAFRAERLGGLLERGRLDEAKDFWRVHQYCRAERLRVPAFDDDDGALDLHQIRRTEDEGQRSGRREGVRVEYEEIDVVVLALGLDNVFAVLPHEELVQLEVFADDGFADARHVS